MTDTRRTTRRSEPGVALRNVLRLRAGGSESLLDAIAEEVPIAMQYNQVPFAVMMASPADLEDFALGFSLSEGLIRTAAELERVAIREHLEGIELSMSVSATAPASDLDPANMRLLPGRAGCGICGTRVLEGLIPPLAPLATTGAYPVASLRKALATLAQHQPMNQATGATHAAAWADASGGIQLLREDVGRHNALDKLIGAMHRNGVMRTDGALLISSRASHEMVSKAAMAGIGIVAAVSAPTALAIDVARSLGICLLGFARSDGYNVYSCPERLLVDEADAPR